MSICHPSAGTDADLILRPTAVNLTHGQPPVHSYRAPSPPLLHPHLLDNGINGGMPCPVWLAPRAQHTRAFAERDPVVERGK
eukprot:4646406-Pyramimonas_sp.AAC.2